MEIAWIKTQPNKKRYQKQQRNLLLFHFILLCVCVFHFPFSMYVMYLAWVFGSGYKVRSKSMNSVYIHLMFLVRIIAGAAATAASMSWENCHRKSHLYMRSFVHSSIRYILLLFTFQLLRRLITFLQQITLDIISTHRLGASAFT